MRAAQYVRMSTEHQQYSVENQIAAIKEYADSHGFEVVRTYSDPARSGLDLKRRPGLRQLIEDVVGIQADYQAVLVFDVSRWGRFQDADESAHYEFLCKSAGVPVHYCAEPFSNASSIADTLLKSLKRTMAAECIRELSAKVFAAQCRIARKGYKLGGSAGFGLRRLLLDSNGAPKAVLEHGQQKSIANDRVSYIAGPPEELQTIRDIYQMFLEENMTVNAIMRELNRRGIPKATSAPWDNTDVLRILSHPKYVGCIVFNQHSAKFRSKQVRNPREQWIVQSDSFESIVPSDRFHQAQQKLASRTVCKTNAQILKQLQEFAQANGRLGARRMLGVKNMPSMQTIRNRFGGLTQAYELIQYVPIRGLAWVEGQKQMVALRNRLQRQLLEELARNHMTVSKSRQIITINGRVRVIVKIARHQGLDSGADRWEFSQSLKLPDCFCIAIRINRDHATLLDYVLFRPLPQRTLFRFSNETARQLGTVARDLAEVVALIRPLAAP
jgi:DNA invertase Pin-like site-specific DNA recombinase